MIRLGIGLLDLGIHPRAIFQCRLQSLSKQAEQEVQVFRLEPHLSKRKEFTNSGEQTHGWGKRGMDS